MENWQDDRDRQTAGLAAIAVILFLALLGSYLIQELRREGEIEDCLLARRLNCDALLERR